MILLKYCPRNEDATSFDLENDVVTGRSGMITNSGGVTNLSESFEVLLLFVIQFSFGFTNVEGIIIPATGFDFCEQLKRSCHSL